MTKLSSRAVGLAMVAMVCAAKAEAVAAPARPSAPVRRTVTTLRCFVQGPAIAPFLGRGVAPGGQLPQQVMVQNTTAAALANGQIEFTVGLASGSGLERPVANVPTSIGAGQTLQVATAYLARECGATFTQAIPIP